VALNQSVDLFIELISSSVQRKYNMDLTFRRGGYPRVWKLSDGRLKTEEITLVGIFIVKSWCLPRLNKRDANGKARD
jgi:hypothetical protein